MIDTVFVLIWGSISIGLATGIAYLIFKRLRQQAGKKAMVGVVAWVLGAVLFVVGYESSVRDTIRERLDPNLRIKELLSKKLEPIAEYPPIKEQMAEFETERKARIYSHKLVAAGLKRLPLEDLILWNSIRRTLASKSDRLCAGLWTGNVTQATLYTAMGKLQPAELDEYANISIKAAKFEADQIKFKAPTETQVEVAYQTIMMEKEEDEKLRFSKVLRLSTDADDKDACWMIKTILADSENLPDDKREALLRSLAGSR